MAHVGCPVGGASSAGARALGAVPRSNAGEAACCPRSRQIAVLRQSRRTHRAQGLRRLPGATAQAPAIGGPGFRGGFRGAGFRAGAIGGGFPGATFNRGGYGFRGPVIGRGVRVAGFPRGRLGPGLGLAAGLGLAFGPEFRVRCCDHQLLRLMLAMERLPVGQCLLSVLLRISAVLLHRIFVLVTKD